jgi:hypothetical protein
VVEFGDQQIPVGLSSTPRQTAPRDHMRHGKQQHSLGVEDVGSITAIVETWFSGPKTVTTNEAVGNPDTVLRYAHDLLPGSTAEAPAPSCGRLLHVKSDRGLGGTIEKKTA